MRLLPGRRASLQPTTPVNYVIRRARTLLLSCIPFVGWIMGGVALSMANTDLPRIDRGYMDREGRGLTVGGQVCGIIAVVINSILAMILCGGINGLFR